MTKIIACKYEDWDDTTNPRLCQCSKYEGVDCANVPDDVASCPDFEAEPTPPSDKRELIAKLIFDDFETDYPVNAIGSWEQCVDRRKEKYLKRADQILKLMEGK